MNKIQYNSITLSKLGGDSIDLIANDAFEGLVIYEDMTAPCLTARLIFKDLAGELDEIIQLGKTIIDINVDYAGSVIQTPVIPSFYGYEFTSIQNEEFPAQKMWEVSCVALDYMQQQSSTKHLELTDEDMWESDDWILPVHEYVEKLHYGHDTDNLMSSQMSYQLQVDPTSNYVWYKTNIERDAESLRRDEEKTIGELIEQAAENACDASNPNAVNFFYWQGMEQWNFRSIEQISKEEPVRTYSATVAYANDPEATPFLGKILSPPQSFSLNELELLDSGGLFATMQFSTPKIREDLKKDWYSGNIKTYFYRTNCNQRTNFPAAIIGFNPADEQEEGSQKNPYRWQYAFVEVYMEWDYESKKPSFKVKPLDQFPIRSSIQFVEREPEQDKDASVEDTGDYFTEPAHNLIEFGNDGLYDVETREGWEAPGFRVDTQLWEESCMKLQPIRGSEPKSAGEFVNSTNVLTLADAESFADDAEVNGKFPIVDMQIYWDKPADESEETSKPHYFFSVANTTDGECTEDDELFNEGDCERP